MLDPRTQDRPDFVQLPSETDAEELSVRILELISDIQGCPEVHLPPLEEYICTDALADMLDETSDSQQIQVAFDYAGTTVLVDSEHRIMVANSAD